MFRGDYESGGDAVCMRSKDLTFEKRLQESLTKNMAPVIATYLLKTFKLPGDDKQHLLTTVLSSVCSTTWKSVCAEHWHSATFKWDFFLTIVSFSS